jgi:membrane protease subunit HflK
MTDMKGLYIVDSDQKAMVPWIGLDSGPTASGPQPLGEGKMP